MEAHTAAFGVFSDRVSTENAVETLKAAGFRNADIVALFPDEIPTKKSRSSQQKRRAAFRNAAAGGGAAVILGGALEWILGAGLYTVAGIGAMVSMAAGGGFIGAWATNRRNPDYEKRYEGRVRR